MIKGFSKLSKEEKRQFIIKNFLSKESENYFTTILTSNPALTDLIDGFSENVVSSYNFPYSIVPNFLIDGKEYVVPMVTEESSVVAAAAKSAAFWYDRGGFHTELLGAVKKGHVHFICSIEGNTLRKHFIRWKPQLIETIVPLDKKMIARGGGIVEINLLDKSKKLKNYFQVEVGFNTCDAMGANYMNSCLEALAAKLMELSAKEGIGISVIMSILSNYSPENAVKVFMECDVQKLDDGKLGMPLDEFVEKFLLAMEIAHIDTYRAVTHNKGLYNGIDAVALATGNDWRAIEANGHAYAASKGAYQSLSRAFLKGNIFRFEATIPMQVGTVGGITTLHPLAKISMEILGHPTANELMKIIASAGLASNFAAVKSLITTGIQKGHMKMHLSNILAGLNASENEIQQATDYFINKTISHSAVEDFIRRLRTNII